MEKISLDDMINEFLDFGMSIIDTSGYENIHSRIPVVDSDGYKYMYSLAYTRRESTLPLPFTTRNPFSFDNIILWVGRNRSDISIVGGEYKGSSKSSIIIKCLKCEHEDFVSPDWIRRPSSCGSCSQWGKSVTENNNLAVVRPDLVKEWNYERNLGTPFDYRPRSSYMAEWICSTCGDEWNAPIENRNAKLFGKGSGCPRCNGNSSKLENEIRRILIEIGVDFDEQVTFDELERKRRHLSFDFYSNGICIEAQGKQHYEPISVFGGSKAFEKQKINDNKKRAFCRKNNIALLEIPYWKFEEISEVLYAEFS